MTSTYTWSTRVEQRIAQLPLVDGAIPTDDRAFWAHVEAVGDGALPPEVLAYLVRIAYKQGTRSAVDRLVSLLWDRYGPHVAYYARGYGGRLRRMVEVDDVAVDVFSILTDRLRRADGVTFYEACFLPGLKRLTLDKVQRLHDEPLISLTTSQDEGDAEEQREVPDDGAVDPHDEALENERRAEMRRAIPLQLRGLPERVLSAAVLLMEGKSEKEIADALGVSTRMVTNYKAALRRALVEFDVVVRPCRPAEDLEPLLALYADAYAADGIGRHAGAQDLRTELHLPGHDPARDRWVVVGQDGDETLQATCMIWKPHHSEGADMALTVHPAWRRRGLGSMLLARALSRARDLGVEHVGAYADHAHGAAQAFARRHTFRPVAAYCEFRAGQDVAPPPISWPDGIRALTYDQHPDPATLVRAMNECYDGQWGHHRVNEAGLDTLLLDLPLDGIFLAFDPSGGIAGTCRVEVRRQEGDDPDEPHGFIDAPGLAPAYRRTTLRDALVCAAFHWLRDRAHAVVGLRSWGDDDEALATYQAAGFSLVRKSVYHLRTLA